MLDDILNPTILIALVALGSWAAWGTLSRRKRNPRRLPLPPGPKGLPFIGNALQITQGKSWETYRDWSTTFGDIIYLEAIGQPIIVLNSIKVINDLLEDKALNYSDRVQTPSLEMLEFSWNLGVCDYGPYWKENRRILHQYFNAGQLARYHPVLEQQSRAFLQRLATDPNEFMDSVKYYVGAVVTQISYGISDPAYLTKLIDNAEAVVDAFTDIALPGRYLVDIFPILRFVPAWFPGAAWKRRLQGYGKRGKETYYGQFEDALGRFRNGIQGQHANIADEIIPQLPDSNDPTYPSMIEKARNATLGAYIGGVDTTTQAARAFFLAMAMYPETQQRAQDELDKVLGTHRLPKPSEMGSLPYITALVKELGRWHTVGPIGVPHRVREDDEYRGYFIPKGTIVMYNSWAMLHDPKIFENPMEFRPERFLRAGELDSSGPHAEYTPFGYGRRKCPGMHLSNEILTFMVASLLAVFAINPAKDNEGNPIPLKYDTGVDLVSKVKPFQVEIKLRSPEHAALLSDY